MMEIPQKSPVLYRRQRQFFLLRLRSLGLFGRLIVFRRAIARVVDVGRNLRNLLQIPIQIGFGYEVRIMKLSG